MGKRRHPLPPLEPPDPAPEYREWSETRYLPGYWTGGRIPPAVRNLWSGPPSPVLGVVLLASAVVTAVAGTVFIVRAAGEDALDRALLALLGVAPMTLVLGLLGMGLLAQWRHRRREHR